MPTTFAHAVPADIALHPGTEPSDGVRDSSLGSTVNSADDEKVRSYIIAYRNQIRQTRWARQSIWNECWQLYRGTDDWSDKDDWQTKIVLPKPWSSVKQATNGIKRLLSTAKNPWTVNSNNPNDQLENLRAGKMTELSKVFLEKANFEQEFSEGLEVGFILGLGVWKVWWGLVPRTRTRVITEYVPGAMQVPPMPTAPGAGSVLQSDMANKETPPPFGQDYRGYSAQNQQMYPTQLPGEQLAPQGWPSGGPGGTMPISVPQKKIVQEDILEGRLFVRAVDPYNFYWLPGSKLNRWVGTIEDTEVARWELVEMAEAGAFGVDGMKKIDAIKPMKIEEYQKMSALRWSENLTSINGPNNDTGVCKVTEFYGPVALADGSKTRKFAHVLIVNDSVVLINDSNRFWHRTPPYIGFSPLNLPLRTEGVGLIEMVRAVDKALNKLTNMSVDTLLLRLLPLFEINIDAFENPEDFQTGITPGKILRRNRQYTGLPGITTVEMPDISAGTVQTAGWLDRSHQEGALVSEIQQSLPRFRGAQTATETELQQQNSQSFMGSLAVDIEKSALEPLITMALDLILQFLDTANDPRVASILGVGAEVLAGIPKPELLEMVSGDYKVKVRGLSLQLEKAEMLQNLVQFMNLIGQNPQAWLPYLNSDALLRRILEAFRPTIHDVEDIIADPATQQAQRAAMVQENVTPDLLRMIPQLAEMAHNVSQQQNDQALQLQKMTHDQEIAKMQMQQQKTQMAADMAGKAADIQMQQQQLQARPQQPSPTGGGQ